MRNYKWLFVIALVLINGCSKQEKDLVIEDESPLFHISFDDAQTKTYIDEEFYLHWNAEDKFSVFNGNTSNEQYKFSGDDGATSGDIEKVSGEADGEALSTNYAIYPYSENTSITNEGVISFTFPSVQTYEENSFGRDANTMVAVTNGIEDMFLSFKNIGGYLKLRLYGSDVTIKSIELKGNNNDKIAGKATITTSHSTNPSVSMSDEATTSITLDCGEGVDLSDDSENPTEFWIVVPPITFEGGFTVTITDTEGKIMTKSTGNEFTVERNTIKSMAAFDVICAEPISSIIKYRTNDGNALTINPNKFDAPILSHTYEDGKGVITFEDTLTEIGDFAFRNCSNLTYIGIPYGVTQIGPFAFYECSGLASISLPESLNSIGSGAFHSCSSLASISLPENLTSIENSAFSGCSSLASIDIPDGVTLIGYYTFYRCSSLTSINIPDGVTQIEWGAFSSCDNLENFSGKYASPDGKCIIKDGLLISFAPKGITSYTIPEEVTRIGNSAFESCSSLASIDIPSGVTTIGDNAFQGCSSLTSINIPDRVYRIGEYAFYDCSSLTSINIPDRVTQIENCTFKGCSSLTSIKIPEGVTQIGSIGVLGSGAFWGCSNLASISLPKSLNSIGDYTFNSCTSLTSINIPDGVTSIGDYAFSNCSSLESISLPESLNSIPRGAFNSCTSLDSIDIPSGVTLIRHYAFQGCSSLTSINIPEGVTQIGYRAFESCSSLTSIDIPEGVTQISIRAFADCTKLLHVYSNPITPPTLEESEVFYNNASGRKIHVKSTSLDAYKSAQYWSGYADYIVGDLE